MRRTVAASVADPRNVDAVNALTDLIWVMQRYRALTRQDAPATALLIQLVKSGGTRPADLATTMQLDQSTVSRHLARLIGDGLAERTSDPSDGRACLVSATEEGRRRAEAAIGARVATFEQIVSAWSDDDRDALARLLGRFSREFEAAIVDDPASAPATHATPRPVLEPR